MKHTHNSAGVGIQGKCNDADSRKQERGRGPEAGPPEGNFITLICKPLAKQLDAARAEIVGKLEDVQDLIEIMGRQMGSELNQKPKGASAADSGSVRE